jgi:hypothetical protein
VTVDRWDLSWLKRNRPLLIAQIVGTPLVVAWFLLFYFQTHSDFALVLIALLPVFAALNILLINGKRARQADLAARRDVPTGRWISPQPTSYGAPPSAARWTGAADIPGELGRMNASTPLAVLELTGSQLTLRIRPSFLSKLFGMSELHVVPGDVDAVFPAKGRLRSPAICVRPHGQPPFYFLLGDRSSILTSIAAAGFPVEWQERTYSPS